METSALAHRIGASDATITVHIGYLAMQVSTAPTPAQNTPGAFAVRLINFAYLK